MTSPIYSQSDSRWGSLKYPSKPYTLSSSGCGCCAVTHCAMEIPKFAAYTPKTERPYMVKYATRGNGTKWIGITAGLKNCGYSVKDFKDSQLKAAFNELDKGNRVGVLLLRKGKKGGIRWTSSGHYVAFVGYRNKNGKHYFKIKDSGHRKHNGWFCFETQMGSLLRHIWICPRLQPAIKNEKPYNKEFPESTVKLSSVGEDVVRVQKFLNHVYGNVLKEDGKFGIKTDSWVGIFQVECDITEDSVVGRNTILHMKRWGR